MIEIIAHITIHAGANFDTARPKSFVIHFSVMPFMGLPINIAYRGKRFVTMTSGDRSDYVAELEALATGTLSITDYNVLENVEKIVAKENATISTGITWQDVRNQY